MSSQTTKTSITITPAFRAKVKDTIKTLIDTHFTNTLGRENDIVNVVNAIAYHESRYNSTAIGPVVSSLKGTYGYKYITSSTCQIILNNSSTDVDTMTKKDNIKKGLRAFGLIQVMGWNVIRGATQTGICEMERLRPDLAPSLIISAGDSLADNFLGEANIEKQLLAGLILLESGYKLCQKSGQNYSIMYNGNEVTFSSKLAGTVATYIGLGKSDGYITPETFINRIMYGEAYIAANGNNTATYTVANNLISSNGPSSSSTGLKPITVVGCG